MEFSLSIFLIIYLILASLFALYALLSLYHIIRFSHFDESSYFMTGLFIAGIILISFVSFTYIIGIDWNQTIQLFDTGGLQLIPATEF